MPLEWRKKRSICRELNDTHSIEKKTNIYEHNLSKILILELIRNNSERYDPIVKIEHIFVFSSLLIDFYFFFFNLSFVLPNKFVSFFDFFFRIRSKRNICVRFCCLGAFDFDDFRYSILLETILLASRIWMKSK